MKDRYLITITTLHGTKHYSVKQVIKYIAGAIFGIILIALLGGYAYIGFLRSKLTTIEKEKQALKAQVSHLKSQVHELNATVSRLNLTLLEKKQKLEDLGSKIEDLETILGISSQEYSQMLAENNLSSDLVKKVFILVPSGKPVEQFRISAGFGWRRHPILHRKEFHPGIDLAASGTVPIKATAEGIVTDAKHSRYGYGNVIKIAHVYGFSTLYGHLRKILVKKGDYVQKGQIIGYMGSTGLSTGQHLHYEVRFDKKPLNPLNFMRWSGANFYAITKRERHVPWESLIKAIRAIYAKAPKEGASLTLADANVSSAGESNVTRN